MLMHPEKSSPSLSTTTQSESLRRSFACSRPQIRALGRSRESWKEGYAVVTPVKPPLNYEKVIQKVWYQGNTGRAAPHALLRLGYHLVCLSRDHKVGQCPFKINADKLVLIQKAKWTRRSIPNQLGWSWSNWESNRENGTFWSRQHGQYLKASSIKQNQQQQTPQINGRSPKSSTPNA